MNDIIKLMKKELIFIKGAMKLQLFIGFVFVVVFPIMNPEFACLGSILVPYFLIYGTIAFEERSKGDVFNVTLPVSRKSICLSKYASAFLYSIISAVLSFLVIEVGSKILPNNPFKDVSTVEPLLVMGMCLVVSLVYIGIILPIIFKYGTEKSRMIILGIYVLAFISLGAIGQLFTDILLVLPMGTMVIMALALFILSILISLRIYENKEFR